MNCCKYLYYKYAIFKRIQEILVLVLIIINIISLISSSLVIKHDHTKIVQENKASNNLKTFIHIYI